MYKPQDYKIEIFYSDEDKCFIGAAPELEGCMTHGKTHKECYKMILDAIELYIDGYNAMGKKLPEPIHLKKYTGKLPLRISPDLHRKIANEASKKSTSINKFIENELNKLVG